MSHQVWSAIRSTDLWAGIKCEITCLLGEWRCGVQDSTPGTKLMWWLISWCRWVVIKKIINHRVLWCVSTLNIVDQVWNRQFWLVSLCLLCGHHNKTPSLPLWLQSHRWRSHVLPSPTPTPGAAFLASAAEQEERWKHTQNRTSPVWTTTDR